MAINVADNFSYKGGKPLDARIKYDTITAMVNTPTADLYDGCFAYVTAEKKNYQYDSSNAVDPTLGKWREFEGGGSGGGHTIEDSDGTALTQRDTLKFGEGFAVSDDSTNEKTVVNLDPMPDTDMSDVLDPLPSIPTRYHKYSTDEQIVGEWVNGKPLYEKAIFFTVPNATTDGSEVHTTFDIADNIDSCWVSEITLQSTIQTNYQTTTVGGAVRVLGIRIFYTSGTSKLYVGNNIKAWNGITGYAMCHYTKTTD